MRLSQEKRKKTLENNPEILIEIGKKIAISRRNFYKKLYEENYLIPYQLYIIEHLSKPIIKIGISESSERRLKDICRDFGESRLIHVIESTYNKMGGLESYLHDFFKEYCKVQPKGDGRTEWFDECILEEAKQLIETTQSHIKL